MNIIKSIFFRNFVKYTVFKKRKRYESKKKSKKNTKEKDMGFITNISNGSIYHFICFIIKK